MQDLQPYAEELRAMLPRGTTVYTILRSKHKSGMRREIALCIFDPQRLEPLYPTWAASRVLGHRIGKRDGLIVHGCGMDMGYHLIERLSQVLYGAGNALRHQWL